MPTVTYGRLEEVLRSLGFTLRGILDKNKVFAHPSGSLVIYPEFSLTEEVYPIHLLRARMAVENFGIADAADFAAMLQQPADAPPPAA